MCNISFFAESSEKLPIIVGSAAAGGLTLVVVVVAIVFLFRRFTNTGKQSLLLIFKSNILQLVLIKLIDGHQMFTKISM